MDPKVYVKICDDCVSIINSVVPEGMSLSFDIESRVYAEGVRRDLSLIQGLIPQRATLC